MDKNTETKRKHPDHSGELGRLSRARGQLEAVSRMIEDDRYCVDILTQLRAARAAIKKVEERILESHVRHCVTDSARKGDAAEVDARLAELFEVISRYTR